MNLEALLLGIIKEQLSGISSPMTVEAITPEIMADLYSLSKHHDTAHIVAAYLDCAGLLDGSQTSEAFRQAQMTQVFRHHRIVAEQKRICQLLEAEKIGHMPLKGAVIRDMYPESWYRPSCDIDILVRREDIDAARDIIVEKLGYSCADRENFHDVDLYSKSGVHLELHFNILENRDNIDRLLSRVYDYATPADEGCQRLVMSDTFLIFHTVAHCYYHFLNGGCGIKPFMDLYIMKGNESLSPCEEELRGMLRECDIEVFYDTCLALNRVWFEDEAHTPLTERFAKYILRGGVYGTTDNAISIRRQKSQGKLGYLASRIFMPYSQMKNRFPVLRKHPYLFPLMQVVRWFGLLSPSRRKKAKIELCTNAAISQSSVDEVSSLIRELGIDL